ncbi:MAG: hypothetical protein ACYC3X_18160 [Pirellulaceae bacterium]
MSMKADLTRRLTTAAEETARQTPVQPLAMVVEQVRRDAVTNSKEYLEETTVPHGGE